MALQKVLRLLSLAFYLLIMLKGQMIAMPLFTWLLFTLFDFGNPGQFFALSGIAGLGWAYVLRNRDRTAGILMLDVVCCGLLAAPLAWRMMEAPFEQFKYGAFIIPAVSFIILYTAAMVTGYRQHRRMQAGSQR